MFEKIGDIFNRNKNLLYRLNAVWLKYNVTVGHTIDGVFDFRLTMRIPVGSEIVVHHETIVDWVAKPTHKVLSCLTNMGETFHIFICYRYATESIETIKINNNDTTETN